MDNSSRSSAGLAPVSGAALYAREIGRRKDLRSRGMVATGCSEIDDALLLGGGFERGCVVGVSAEELDFGVLLGLQTIARALVFEDRTHAGLPLPQGEKKQKATIITTLPATTILPMLRDIIRCQVQAKLGPRNLGIDAELRRCLEAISISRIFDIDGLWEVLRELEPIHPGTRFTHTDVVNEETIALHAADQHQEEKRTSEVERAEKGSTGECLEEDESTKQAPEQGNADEDPVTLPEPSQKHLAYSPERITELPPLRIGPELRPPARRAEVLDSEDEEPLSSSPLSSPPPSTVATVSLSQFEEQQPPQSPVHQESQLSSSPLSSPPPSTIPSESSSQIEAQPQEQPQEQHPPLVEAEPEDNPSPNSKPEERPQTTEAPQTIMTENTPPPIPDIILITHFSALLTTLFTHSDKPAAHQNLQNLSSHLRHLAQSAGSLIMLLNTTTSPVPETSYNTATSTSLPPPSTMALKNPAHTPPPPPQNQQPQRPLEATLRSIFNPAMIPHHHFQGYNGNSGNNSISANAAASRLTRRNKPSFGATFAQFLDLHLLCTRVPRTRDDAETAVALLGAAGSEDVRYAWVVEALLDESGFWDWGNKDKGGRGREGEDGDDMLPPRRVNREQRWAAVDVRDRVAVVNAFGREGTGAGSVAVSRGPIRLAAGFGGRRV